VKYTRVGHKNPALFCYLKGFFMAKTLLDCTTQTRVYLDEQVAADWTDAQVLLAINAAYQMVITAVMEVYEDYYMSTTTLPTVVDQNEYLVAGGLPSNLFKIRRIEINYNPSVANSNSNRLMDEARSNLNNNLVGLSVYRNPAYYSYGFGDNLTIGIIPAVQSAGATAFKLWYIPLVADMAASGDSVNVPYADRFWWAIPLLAAGSLLRKGQQEESAAATYIRDGQLLLDDMRELLEDRVAEEGKVIVDVMSEETDFGVPFN
jgi:hypothetical protein